MWDMAIVGLVGLGVMGGGIAGRLLAADHEVNGLEPDASQAEPLEERGRPSEP
jgi:3-hydroxyisobutyrate dehydrogenase-like beta-hydroxyacid dehydrogenase